MAFRLPLAMVVTTACLRGIRLLRGNRAATTLSNGAAKARLRLAVIACPGSYDYGAMFDRFLNSAAGRHNGRVAVETIAYDAVADVLPAPDDDAFDGFLISGSVASANDEDAWVKRLSEWVRETHSRRRRLVGICFGHQILAEALGGRVEVNPHGWGVGQDSWQLSEAANAELNSLRRVLETQIGQAVPPRTTTARRRRRDDGGICDDGAISVMYIHGDHVAQGGLPQGLQSMGGSALTPHCGSFNSSNILTFQGHPEFTPKTVREIVARLKDLHIVPGKLPDGESEESVQESLKVDLDSAFLGDCILGFFLRKT